MMIKEGQIYKRSLGEILLITQSEPRIDSIDNLNMTVSDLYSYISKLGKTGSIHKSVIEGLNLIAEYPTWQQAVNSKEFKNIDCCKDGYKTTREIELEKKLKIAVKAINTVLNDEFILEHADAGLLMFLQVNLNKIKEIK